MHNKTTFENGLRLITVPSKSTKSATVFIFFGVGSRHESKDINGVSHFLEHLMFKGTKKRPTTLDIAKALDSVGAEFNAMTSKDWTGYYIKIDAKKLDLALDILSDMLYNSKFDPKEIDKERGVILEEINMYKDNPLMYLEDVLEQAIFKGSTLGWEIAGPKKVIREVPREKMLNYLHKYYVPENTVIGVAGNFNKEIVGKVKKYFKTQPKRADKDKIKSEYGFKPFVSKQKAPQVILEHKKTEQVQLGFGFPGYSYFDERTYALKVLSIILGGNMSARLFIEVREKRGLAYSIHSYTNVYQDTGAFIVKAGVDKSRIDKSISVILSELKKVKRNGVTPQELTKAKEFLRGKIVLNLEDTSSLASWYAKQELMQNESLTPNQKLKKFEAVTAAQIKAVAGEAFKTENINLALIGPYKDKKRFEKLLKI